MRPGNQISDRKPTQIPAVAARHYRDEVCSQILISSRLSSGVNAENIFTGNVSCSHGLVFILIET